MSREIQILKELIETTAHTVTVDSITDNGGNSYTIETCNTFYLNVGKTFTIDSVDYTITDFVMNESITFTGASIPDVETFDIEPPKFVYGTPKFVNIELSKMGKSARKYPFIWCVEITNTERNDSPSARIKSTPSFNLLFLDEIDKSRWTIQDHYDNAIDTQGNEVAYIIRVLKHRKDLFETEDLTHETLDHANFGDYIVNRGYDRKILSDDVSGVQCFLRLPYIVDVCNSCEAPIVSRGAIVFTLNGVQVYAESGNINKEFHILA